MKDDDSFEVPKNWRDTDALKLPKDSGRWKITFVSQVPSWLGIVLLATIGWVLAHFIIKMW